MRNEAREFARAHGMSLDQFVAAAVGQEVASLCAPETTKWNTGQRPMSVRQE
jgi:hypothetical protein